MFALPPSLLLLILLSFHALLSAVEVSGQGVASISTGGLPVSSLACDSGGSVYFASNPPDSTRGVVLRKLAPDGSVLVDFSRSANMVELGGLAVNSFGAVFVTDVYQRWVIVFHPNGSQQAAWDLSDQYGGEWAGLTVSAGDPYSACFIVNNNLLASLLVCVDSRDGSVQTGGWPEAAEGIFRDSNGVLYYETAPNEHVSRFAECDDTYIGRLECDLWGYAPLPSFIVNASAMGLDAFDNVYFAQGGSNSNCTIAKMAPKPFHPKVLDSWSSVHACSNGTVPLAVPNNDTLYTAAADGTSILHFSLTRCRDGYYCQQGAENATKCPAGSYCPEQWLYMPVVLPCCGFQCCPSGTMIPEPRCLCRNISSSSSSSSSSTSSVHSLSSSSTSSTASSAAASSSSGSSDGDGGSGLLDGWHLIVLCAVVAVLVLGVVGAALYSCWRRMRRVKEEDGRQDARVERDVLTGEYVIIA